MVKLETPPAKAKNLHLPFHEIKGFVTCKYEILVVACMYSQKMKITKRIKLFNPPGSLPPPPKKMEAFKTRHPQSTWTFHHD
jgi:hypothetical protein